jgi:hypothetical protein
MLSGTSPKNKEWSSRITSIKTTILYYHNHDAENHEPLPKMTISNPRPGKIINQWLGVVHMMPRCSWSFALIIIIVEIKPYDIFEPKKLNFKLWRKMENIK